ncbi:Putative cytoplasmic protein [Salmonella enterica subsp. enterica]|nr:Putative cytoplasmic protein [Salmonella enterica subsp. enterica]
MDGQTLHAWAKRFALELPFTEHCWPFGPQYDVFKVGGKIFMLFTEHHCRPVVNLKSDPQKSLGKSTNLPQHCAWLSHE